jgi:two-component system sensor histidine kinase RegB
LSRFRIIAVLPLAGMLSACNAVVLAPAGDIAEQQRNLLIESTVLMLLIIIPVMALTALFAWRYRDSNTAARYEPDWNHSTQLELVIWSAPLLIIICLGAVTWASTHLLDPYRPLDRIATGQSVTREAGPLKVDVVALDWKWLFIYPDYGIATVNELAAPVNRPIAFRIAASSVMNSFYIPALAGQVFIWLTAFYQDIFLLREQGGNFARLHIQGMFICFVLSATLLVLFITRINRNLRARDAHLARLRQQSAEEDHIVRMGLLASGAAHELGTPLATLSVILNDWQHMPTLKETPELSQEIVEMQAQVERCKTIVSGILMSSGEARGEGTLRTTVNAFVDGLATEWRASRSPTRFEYANAFGKDAAIVSDTALKQVIFNLFDNALEASPNLVEVGVRRTEDDLVITVSDEGPGFSEEMLAEFGKPYRSSKGRPGGGLGLFLVVNVVRKLGGVIAAENTAGKGAIVTLTLPLASLSPGGNHGD